MRAARGPGHGNWLHLAAVGKQLPRRRCELLVTVALGGAVQHVDGAALDPGDLGVDRFPPTMQFSQPRLRFGLGAVRHLPEQFEERVQPGFGADEGASAQTGDPAVRLLNRRGDIEVSLARSRR